MTSPRSSFYWPMRLLPRTKRQAMFALYGFCRAVDDISDGGAPLVTKQAQLTTLRAALTAWRQTGVALHPALVPLVPWLGRFSMPVDELELLLDGMENDVNQPLTAPSLVQLQLYCRQVAGTVGILTLHILGRPDATAYALALAEALQLTNILRDLGEDAERGRLYLPLEYLEAAGITVHSPRAVLSHPHLDRACAQLARLAQERFDQARAELARQDKRGLWPARAMMAIYQALLRRLPGRRWGGAPPRLGAWRKVWLAVAALCLPA